MTASDCAWEKIHSEKIMNQYQRILLEARKCTQNKIVKHERDIKKLSTYKTYLA